MTDGLIGAGGWLADARRVASPNQDERPDGECARLIVIHSISLPPGRFGGDAIEQLFTNRLDPAGHPYFREVHRLRVSAHFLVRRDGELIQFVATTRRAWHAGASCWRGRERCNDFTIGIEVEGADDQDFTASQYERLAVLLKLLREQHPIEAVVGHADIAPGRKTDPGPHFNWHLLRDSTDD
jgi:N-acetyl-anhydromuramoyl-L-alanine amidase